jgi:hypothetical protein
VSENQAMRITWPIYPEMTSEIGFIAQNLAEKTFCADIFTHVAQKTEHSYEMAGKLS